MEAKKTAKNGVRWRFVVTPYAPHQERRWPNDNDKEVSTHSEKTWLSFLFSPKKKPYGLIVRFCCGYCTIIFHAKLMPSLLKYEIHSRTKLIPEWKSFQNMITWIAFQFYNLLKESFNRFWPASAFTEFITICSPAHQHKSYRNFITLLENANINVFRVLLSCTGSQEPIQKTQQCSTAKQRFVKKGVQWLFPLCTGTPGHNHFLNWTCSLQTR